MPFISEVSPIFIQRFYTGWITLRNQLVTPIRVMGRRIIELYDALISGNDWEVTPKLSLKRRAGHTFYVTPNFQVLNYYSWKSNTMGTIPILDTTGDIEYIAPGSTTGTAITTKTVATQSGILGIGNYFYMGNTSLNVKWDGPSGSQGVTNWGIAINSGHSGPTTATTGVNNTSGLGTVPWTNPSNVTGSSGYASATTLSGQNTEFLQCGGFGFSIPATTQISGILVTANLSNTAGASSPVEIFLYSSFSGNIGLPKEISGSGTPAAVSAGGTADLWGASTITPNQVNGSAFNIMWQAGSGATTAQINEVVVTIYTGLQAEGVPTGSGSFSAVNGYTYTVAYGNSKSGEISNGSPPGTNTGPFTSKAYVGVAVTASTDTQVDQIRVYRTTDSGGGNQFFEISNSPFANTSTTIQDTTPDVNLQVTSQAEINLGNTPPPAGLVNLEWFAGRMWGTTNNLLWASTGPETLSGTAPNSNWNPLFQWVIPGVIQRLKTGPNGMLVFTQDECYIVRGTDIVNYTVNLFVKDFGVRSYNAIDTDGTNLYVFTSDRQFIQISAAGANDLGQPIADQLQSVDPTQVYVTVNRYGLDSIVRVLDAVNNLYYDYNLNQQCWNLPGLLQMPATNSCGSIEVSPGIWRLIMCSNTVVDGVVTASQLAFRDIQNYQDLGTSYSPVAVFGSIQLADPGNLAKFGARGGFVMEYTNAGSVPSLSVLPNDIGCNLTNVPGAQVIGNFVSLSVANQVNGIPWPPTLANQPSNYRSLGYYYMMGKGDPLLGQRLSAFVRHLQFQLQAPAENFGTELIGFGIFGDEKGEAMAGQLPQLQGR